MENRSIGKSPFSIVYCCLSKHALDLVALPKLPGISIATENMADRIHAIQEEARNQLEAYVDKLMRGVFGEIGFNGVVEVLGCVSDAAKNTELKKYLGTAFVAVGTADELD
ncbi:kanadaptin-like protein, partial [Fagus crenata]